MKAQLASLVGIGLVLLLGFALALAAGGPVLAGLPLMVWCALLAFVIQWLMFLPAWLFQTERYYDLTGSMTYISVALLALFLSGRIEPGSLLIVAMILIWALRLGIFLFTRILDEGGDRRFERIKPRFLRFLMTWTLQGLWVVVTSAAGLAAVASGQPFPLGPLVIFGALLWCLGFAIEVTADRQKRLFRKRPANREAFICEGLWRYARHPNYFGEILLWTGIAVMAVPVLAGWQYLTLVSPLFVYLLLTRVSGIRMLEASAQQRWGDDPAYRTYLATTSRLFPLPPRIEQKR
jgi:steroid 5-alpha reductase family enzyme